MTNEHTPTLNQKISRRLCKFPIDFQDFREEKIPEDFQQCRFGFPDSVFSTSSHAH